MTLDLILRGLILVLGAYYVIAIGIFQIGLNSPRAQRMVSRIGLTGARLFYAAIGLTGILLVLFGVL